MKQVSDMEATEKSVTNRRAIFGVAVAGGVLMVLASVFYFDVIVDRGGEWLAGVGPEFFLFVLGGFIAQMIDGSLGMAYGVSASTFLMSFGVPPAAASASVHTAEIFTSGASGLSHLRLQN